MSDNRFDKLDDKLDKVVQRLGSIDTTLAKQEVSLSDHIRRTEILENRIEPIEKNFVMFYGFLKILGGISMVLGMIKCILFFIKR